MSEYILFVIAFCHHRSSATPLQVLDLRGAGDAAPYRGWSVGSESCTQVTRVCSYTAKGNRPPEASAVLRLLGDWVRFLFFPANCVVSPDVLSMEQAE